VSLLIAGLPFVKYFNGKLSRSVGSTLLGYQKIPAHLDNYLQRKKLVYLDRYLEPLKSVSVTAPF
jgi:hypothetical protein